MSGIVVTRYWKFVGTMSILSQAHGKLSFHGELSFHSNLSFHGKLSSLGPPLLRNASLHNRGKRRRRKSCPSAPIRLCSLRCSSSSSSSSSSERQQQQAAPQTQQNNEKEEEKNDDVGTPAPASGRSKKFQSSWDAKDSQGKDYLYMLGKESANMNISVGARSGMIDDLFVGNVLGKEGMSLSLLHWTSMILWQVALIHVCMMSLVHFSIMHWWCLLVEAKIICSSGNQAYKLWKGTKGGRKCQSLARICVYEGMHCMPLHIHLHTCTNTPPPCPTHAHTSIGLKDEDWIGMWSLRAVCFTCGTYASKMQAIHK